MSSQYHGGASALPPVGGVDVYGFPTGAGSSHGIASQPYGMGASTAQPPPPSGIGLYSPNAPPPPQSSAPSTHIPYAHMEGSQSMVLLGLPARHMLRGKLKRGSSTRRTRRPTPSKTPSPSLRGPYNEPPVAFVSKQKPRGRGRARSLRRRRQQPAADPSSQAKAIVSAVLRSPATEPGQDSGGVVRGGGVMRGGRAAGQQRRRVRPVDRQLNPWVRPAMGTTSTGRSNTDGQSIAPPRHHHYNAPRGSPSKGLVKNLVSASHTDLRLISPPAGTPPEGYRPRRHVIRKNGGVVTQPQDHTSVEHQGTLGRMGGFVESKSVDVHESKSEALSPSYLNGAGQSCQTTVNGKMEEADDVMDTSPTCRDDGMPFVKTSRSLVLLGGGAPQPSPTTHTITTNTADAVASHPSPSSYRRIFTRSTAELTESTALVDPLPVEDEGDNTDGEGKHKRHPSTLVPSIYDVPGISAEVRRHALLHLTKRAYRSDNQAVSPRGLPQAERGLVKHTLPSELAASHVHLIHVGTEVVEKPATPEPTTNQYIIHTWKDRDPQANVLCVLPKEEVVCLIRGNADLRLQMAAERARLALNATERVLADDALMLEYEAKFAQLRAWRAEVAVLDRDARRAWEQRETQRKLAASRQNGGSEESGGVLDGDADSINTRRIVAELLAGTWEGEEYLREQAVKADEESNLLPADPMGKYSGQVSEEDIMLSRGHAAWKAHIAAQTALAERASHTEMDKHQLSKSAYHAIEIAGTPSLPVALQGRALAGRNQRRVWERRDFVDPADEVQEEADGDEAEGGAGEEKDAMQGDGGDGSGDGTSMLEEDGAGAGGSLEPHDPHQSMHTPPPSTSPKASAGQQEPSPASPSGTGASPVPDKQLGDGDGALMASPMDAEHGHSPSPSQAEDAGSDTHMDSDSELSSPSHQPEPVSPTGNSPTADPPQPISPQPEELDGDGAQEDSETAPAPAKKRRCAIL